MTGLRSRSSMTAIFRATHDDELVIVVVGLRQTSRRKGVSCEFLQHAKQGSSIFQML